MGRIQWTWRAACLVAAATGTFGATAIADVIQQPLYYTKYNLVNPASPTETNVKKVIVTTDRVAQSVNFSPRVDLIRTLGADGINLFPDTTPLTTSDNQIIVGGQFFLTVHRIDPNTSPATLLQSVGCGAGCTGAYHIIVDPRQDRIYATEQPGAISVVPITVTPPTLGAAVIHPILGDNAASGISTIAFVANSPTNVFYTASNPGGQGDFGKIDLTTYTTTRYFVNQPGFHGMQYDPYSGTLICCGSNHIIQINPTTPPTILADIAIPATLQLDQLAVDGSGMVYAASNTGHLVTLDYRTPTKRINDSGAYHNVQFLDDNLDDVAPILTAEPPNVCCELGTGEFNRQNGQLSQDPPLAESNHIFRTADDFYLEPGCMYNLKSFKGRMFTDADPSLWKANLEIYKDCDGKPGDLIKRITGGNVVDTGTIFSAGSTSYKVVEVTFQLQDFWLKGGDTYWVSFIGAGTASPFDPNSLNQKWFWGTAGVDGAVMGKPGVFKAPADGFPNWVSIDTVCCGCTDFNFCIDFHKCKILLDNGTYDAANLGSPSMDNFPNSSTLVKTADDFVVPPCDPVKLCYIEAYIWTNCVNARLDLYENSCDLPASNTPIRTFTPTKIIDTGYTRQYSGAGGSAVGNTVTLHLLCLQFCGTSLTNDMTIGGDGNIAGVTLQGGRNYWLSAYGLGNGSANQVAWFAFNKDCKNPCLVNFNDGAIRGPGIGEPDWIHYAEYAGGGKKNFAFIVAVEPAVDRTSQSGTSPGGTCAADINHSGSVTVQDVFDFLSAWFAGCP